MAPSHSTAVTKALSKFKIVLYVYKHETIYTTVVVLISVRHIKTDVGLAAFYKSLFHWLVNDRKGTIIKLGSCPRDEQITNCCRSQRLL